MKNYFLVISFILICHVSKADVIFAPASIPGVRNHFAWSLEGIVSYEMAFTKLNSVNLWGGMGFVSTLNHPLPPALGTEAAVEFRQYFVKNKFAGINLDVYLGLAYMLYPQEYPSYNGKYWNSTVGLVPGIKLTYKIKLKKFLVMEPYVSLSAPWYAYQGLNLSDRIFNDKPDRILTIGIRIGFNKVKK